MKKITYKEMKMGDKVVACADATRPEHSHLIWEVEAHGSGSNKGVLGILAADFDGKRIKYPIFLPDHRDYYRKYEEGDDVSTAFQK